MSAAARDEMTISEARTLFLGAQGLLSATDRPASAGATLREIERLGFVQLDSINIIERAHHHILFTRLHAYRPGTLDRLQREGRVFEHWTHDASVIPTPWFPHWRHRFNRVAWGTWLRSRMGADYEKVLEGVMGRIRTEGPLQARDFAHSGVRSGPWWDWKPAKAALEYWWRRGDLAVPRRVRFEKVYDLTERVLPQVHAMAMPEADDHADWACRSALERLGVGTAREIAHFWNFLKPPQVAAWCAAAVARGEVVPVRPVADPGVEVTGKLPAIAYALPDWRARVRRSAAAPEAMRVLSPFDPVIRDRARALRLFGFDYRFEAFVPERKRVHGYYTLPIMRGERMIGRLDPKLDREAGVLRVRRVWWEEGMKPTRALGRELEGALHGYAAFAGAAAVEMPAR